MTTNEGPSYPILKNSVILQIMSELEIPLTESELIEPGRYRDRVREVLCEMLCHCWRLERDELTTLSSRTKSHLTTPGTSISAHPQLYSDALVETKFFCMLQKLLRICGYEDFGLRDLAAPNGRRLRRQLSAMINFMKYREDNIHLFDNEMEEREAIFEALNEVAEEQMNQMEKLRGVREIYQTKLLEKEEAEAECLEMEEELAQQNKIQTSIRQQKQLLQKSATDLKDQIANLSIALRELQAEERQLNKEVVHSPDRIKADVHNAEKALAEVKKMIGEKEEERNDEARRLKNAVKGEELLKKSMGVIDDLDKKIQEYEVAAKDVGVLKCNADEVEKSLEKTRLAKEEQDVEIRAIEQQHNETKSKLTEQLNSAKMELNSAGNKLGIVEEERLDGMAKMEASQRRVEELEVTIEKKKKQAENDIRRRIETFQKFEKEILAKRKDLEPFIVC